MWSQVALSDFLTLVPLLSFFGPALDLVHGHAVETCKRVWVLLVSGVPNYSKLPC